MHSRNVIQLNLAPTVRASDPAPLICEMKLQRDRGVRCDLFVRPRSLQDTHHWLNSLARLGIKVS